MKLHYLKFKSGREFLADYEEKDGKGGLVFSTRGVFERGEIFILEIKFPVLPNRVLIKAEVIQVQNDEKKESTGVSCSESGPAVIQTRFLDTEKSKKEFLLAMAKNHEKFKRNRPAKRNHRRFPVTMTVNWQVKGVELRHRGTIEDLSGGGAFVCTEWPPPEGTDLNLTLYPEDERGPLRLSGRVAWIKEASKKRGMGVRFKNNNHGDMLRIRRLIRRIDDSGKSSCLKESHPTVF